MCKSARVSSDRVVLVLQVDAPWESPFKLTGHTDTVTAVAWSPTDLGKVSVTLLFKTKDLMGWQKKTTTKQQEPADVCVFRL